MTKKEYNDKIEAINAKCRWEIVNVQSEYVESNNLVKIGDLITDHFHTIKVESWHPSFASCSKYPCLVYHGIQYTKTGNVAKKQRDTEMWQSNIKFVNGVEIK